MGEPEASAGGPLSLVFSPAGSVAEDDESSWPSPGVSSPGRAFASLAFSISDFIMDSSSELTSVRMFWSVCSEISVCVMLGIAFSPSKTGTNYCELSSGQYSSGSTDVFIFEAVANVVTDGMVPMASCQYSTRVPRLITAARILRAWASVV